MDRFYRKKYLEDDIKEYKRFPADEKPILFVRNLQKKYFGKKKSAIDHIRFDVYPGQFHAFLGANGAGKTTTIKSLIGAYSQWGGTILIGGLKSNSEKAKKKLGYIPETARFPEKFSAQEYLEWMVMLSGVKRIVAKQYAISKLKELGMYSLRSKSPNSFSSGQKKKILLAQALIHDPDIIIMDEPVANLDPAARTEFFDTLTELRKKGKAIFISSHVLAELDLYADSITVLDGGKVQYSGSKIKLLQKYATKKHCCVTQEIDRTKKYLDDNKINYDFFQLTKTFILFFTGRPQLERFQRDMISRHIYMEKFEEMYPTLDDVYKKIIIKGSVDTMDSKPSKSATAKAPLTVKLPVVPLRAYGLKKTRAVSSTKPKTKKIKVSKPKPKTKTKKIKVSKAKTKTKTKTKKVSAPKKRKTKAKGK